MFSSQQQKEKKLKIKVCSPRAHREIIHHYISSCATRRWRRRSPIPTKWKFKSFRTVCNSKLLLSVAILCALRLFSVKICFFILRHKIYNVDIEETRQARGARSNNEKLKSWNHSQSRVVCSLSSHILADSALLSLFHHGYDVEASKRWMEACHDYVSEREIEKEREKFWSTFFNVMNSNTKAKQSEKITSKTTTNEKVTRFEYEKRKYNILWALLFFLSLLTSKLSDVDNVK